MNRVMRTGHGDRAEKQGREGGRAQSVGVMRVHIVYL